MSKCANPACHAHVGKSNRAPHGQKMHTAMYSKLQIKHSTSFQASSLSELHRKSPVLAVVCGSAERKSAYLSEADVVGLLAEAATADKHAVLADETCEEMFVHSSLI